MKHTPGPWRIEDGARIMPPHNATQLPIAKMGQLQHESQIEANARLIAAAPELLEAAELALKVLEQSGMITRQLLDADKELRAAIAKAKGEQ